MASDITVPNVASVLQFFPQAAADRASNQLNAALRAGDQLGRGLSSFGEAKQRKKENKRADQRLDIQQQQTDQQGLANKAKFAHDFGMTEEEFAAASGQELHDARFRVLAEVGDFEQNKLLQLNAATNEQRTKNAVELMEAKEEMRSKIAGKQADERRKFWRTHLGPDATDEQINTFVRDEAIGDYKQLQLDVQQKEQQIQLQAEAVKSAQANNLLNSELFEQRVAAAGAKLMADTSESNRVIETNKLMRAFIPEMVTLEAEGKRNTVALQKLQAEHLGATIQAMPDVMKRWQGEQAMRTAELNQRGDQATAALLTDRWSRRAQNMGILTREMNGILNAVQSGKIPTEAMPSFVRDVERLTASMADLMDPNKNGDSDFDAMITRMGAIKSPLAAPATPQGAGAGTTGAAPAANNKSAIEQAAGG